MLSYTRHHSTTITRSCLPSQDTSQDTAAHNLPPQRCKQLHPSPPRQRGCDADLAIHRPRPDPKNPVISTAPCPLRKSRVGNAVSSEKQPATRDVKSPITRQLCRTTRADWLSHSPPDRRQPFGVVGGCSIFSTTRHQLGNTRFLSNNTNLERGSVSKVGTETEVQ